MSTSDTYYTPLTSRIDCSVQARFGAVVPDSLGTLLRKHVF